MVEEVFMLFWLSRSLAFLSLKIDFLQTHEQLADFSPNLDLHLFAETDAGDCRFHRRLSFRVLDPSDRDGMLGVLCLGFYCYRSRLDEYKRHF